jgi:tRNA G10  N-methylase Trm11
LRPAWANSSQDPISKITRAKLTRGVAQVICQWEALSSNHSPTKKKKKKKRKKINPFFRNEEETKKFMNF